MLHLQSGLLPSEPLLLLLPLRLPLLPLLLLLLLLFLLFLLLSSCSSTVSFPSFVSSPVSVVLTLALVFLPLLFTPRPHASRPRSATNPIPRNGRVHRQGPSMLPTLNPSGDVVLVEHLSKTLGCVSPHSAPTTRPARLSRSTHCIVYRPCRDCATQQGGSKGRG